MKVTGNRKRIMATMTALAVLLVPFIVLSSTQPAQAAACTKVGQNFRGGSNHPSQLFAGKRCSTKDEAGYCMDYNDNFPTGRGDEVQNIAGLSTVKTHQLFYLINKHGATTDPAKAALVYFAANTIVGSNAFLQDYASSYKAQLGSTRAQAVNALVTEAVNYAGPSRLVVTITKPTVNNGDVGELTVEVRSARNLLIPNVPVTLSLIGARGPTAVVTSAAAARKVSFTQTAAQVRVQASTNVVNSTTGWITRTDSPNDQRLVYAAAPTTPLKATAGYSNSLTWTCPSNCDGKVVVTLKACASGDTKARYTVKKNHATLAQVDVSKGCVTKQYVTRDNDALAVNYAATTGTRPLPAARQIATIRVVCPPLPAPTIEAGCDCSNPGKVKGVFKAINTTTVRYLQVVSTIDGAVVRTDWVYPGQRYVSPEFTWDSGVSVTVRAQFYDTDPAKGTGAPVGTPGQLTAVYTTNSTTAAMRVA